MTAVAGDFYEFLPIHPGCFGILVADVVGHGVPAALVASMVKVAVSTQVESAAEPGKVVAGLNSILCRQAQGQYTTAVYIYLDEGGRVGRYSAAGHPPPLLWRRSTGTLNKLQESGLLLGVRSTEAYAQTEFPFEPGDRLLLYTDGLLEAENPTGESYGEVRLTNFIEAHQNLGTEQFADRLLSDVLAWPEREERQTQDDDITLVVIDHYELRITPPL
jgi:serine phosphatase RsbU (regulator of sigma subunit)